MPNWLRQLGKWILKKCQWIYPISWKKLRMLCRCFFHVGVPCFFSLSLAASFSQISMGFLFRFQKNYTFKWCIFPSAVLSLPTVSIHFRHGAEPPSQQRIHLPNSLFAGRDHHASRKHSFCWGKDFPVLVRC